MEYLSVEGTVSCARLLELLELGEPGPCRGRLEWLIDLSNARLDAEAEDVRRLSAELAGHRGQGHDAERLCRAAVVARDDFTFGMLRMLSVYAEGFAVSLHVARTRAEAAAWLQIDSDGSTGSGGADGSGGAQGPGRDATAGGTPGSLPGSHGASGSAANPPLYRAG